MNNNNLFQHKIMVYVLALISCALWGSAFPTIKIGYSLFQIPAGNYATQIMFAGIRFTLSGLMVIVIGSLVYKKIIIPQNKEQWSQSLILSSFQTVLQYIFFYVGLANTSGVKAAIIQGSNVFVALLITCLLFKMEKLTSKKILGCIIGFIGVVIANLAKGSTLDFNFIFIGEGFIFGATLCYAFSSIMMKRYSKKTDQFLLVGYQFFIGGLIMIAIGVVLGADKINLIGSKIFILIYLGFLSAGAYTIWSTLLKYNPISKIAIFGFTVPIFGVTFSTLLLKNESAVFNVKMLIALILVCIGIIVLNISEDIEFKTLRMKKQN